MDIVGGLFQPQTYSGEMEPLSQLLTSADEVTVRRETLTPTSPN